LLLTGELSKPPELSSDDSDDAAVAVLEPSLAQLRQPASSTPVGLRGADREELRVAVLGGASGSTVALPIGAMARIASWQLSTLSCSHKETNHYYEK
jgi:hypothetical protein